MGAGTPKRGGSAKIGRGFLPLTDRHMTRMQDFNQLQRKLRPTADSKDFIGCVNHSVNLISYTMLQKMLTPKPTPHLSLTLTSEIGAEKKVAVQEISS